MRSTRQNPTHWHSFGKNYLIILPDSDPCGFHVTSNYDPEVEIVSLLSSLLPYNLGEFPTPPIITSDLQNTTGSAPQQVPHFLAH